MSKLELDQRFYTSQFGRFLSADRFKQAAKANDSGSWNKYSYTLNDPINWRDPHGLFACGGQDDEGNDPDCNEDGDQSGKTPSIPGPTYTFMKWTFSEVGNTGANEKRILGLVDWLGSNIDSDCSSWLTSGSGFSDSYPGGFSQYLSSLEQGGADGTAAIGYAQVSGDRNSVLNAITGTGFEGLAIILNLQGDVFNSNAPGSHGSVFDKQIFNIKSGTQEAGIFTLLHEIAHSLSAPGFRDDAGNQKAVNLNNDDIWSHCNKTLSGASNK